MMMMRYLEFFETTGPLAASIMKIFIRDFVPFSVIYMVLLIGCALALRITTSNSTTPDDPVLGNIWRVMLTLEEATHGPDVQWRNVIFSQPVVASVIFLFFLWAVAILCNKDSALVCVLIFNSSRHCKDKICYKTFVRGSFAGREPI